MKYTYSDAKNPMWMNKAKTRMDIEVDWDHIPEDTYSPCGICDLNGVAGEEHLAHLWNRALAGDFGPIKEYERPADLTTEETINFAEVRSLRNRLLAASDYAIAPDKWEDMSAEEKKAWKDYRQALKDVPQNWTMTASYDDDEEVYKLPEEYTFPRAPDAS